MGHSARLHNYVRILKDPKKRVHTGFDKAITQTAEAGLTEAIASYFQGLSQITLGQVAVTLEKATLTPLAGALQGQPSAGNNPVGTTNPGGGNPSTNPSTTQQDK